MMWYPRSCLCGVLLLACSAPVSAQQALFVPPGYAQRESTSVGMIAGFNARMRQQILIDGTALSGLAGKRITAISFRRDVNDGDAIAATSAQLVVSISASALAPSRASRTFADNRRGQTVSTVFSGTLSLPAASPITPPIPWSSPHVARIPFASTYPWTPGSLCIQIEGEPGTRPAYWPVDFADDDPVGTVRPVGVPCGYPAAVADLPAGAAAESLLVGGTVSLSAFGRPGTPGFMVLSGRRISPPFALDVIGATGCALHVPTDLSFPAPFGNAIPGFQHGTAFHDLHLPANPSFAGATLYAQWANLETGTRSNPLGLTTTNALELNIATRIPNSPVTVVETDPVPATAPFPQRGYVKPSRGPVIRIEYR